MPLPKIPKGHLTAQMLADRWGTHVVTIHRWACDGTLPPPILLPGKPRLWREADVATAERNMAKARAIKAPGQKKKRRAKAARR